MAHHSNITVERSSTRPSLATGKVPKADPPVPSADPLVRREQQASQRRLRRLVRVGETAVGRGIFARRRIEADTVVGEVLGEVLNDHPDDPDYCMELDSGRILEPAPPLRFINHSCEPNCELFYYEEDDPSLHAADRLWLHTLRVIEPGEQLLIDYAWPADAAIPCRCGSPTCREWIVAPEERHKLPVAQAT